jgi:hypothetical protein
LAGALKGDAKHLLVVLRYIDDQENAIVAAVRGSQSPSSIYVAATRDLV